jgi:hypothetical protein
MYGDQLFCKRRWPPCCCGAVTSPPPPPLLIRPCQSVLRVSFAALLLRQSQMPKRVTFDKQQSSRCYRVRVRQHRALLAPLRRPHAPPPPPAACCSLSTSTCTRCCRRWLATASSPCFVWSAAAAPAAAGGREGMTSTPARSCAHLDGVGLSAVECGWVRVEWWGVGAVMQKRKRDLRRCIPTQPHQPVRPGPARRAAERVRARSR